MKQLSLLPVSGLTTTLSNMYHNAPYTKAPIAGHMQLLTPFEHVVLPTTISTCKDI